MAARGQQKCSYWRNVHLKPSDKNVKCGLVFEKCGFNVTTGMLYQVFMKQEHRFVRPARILGNFSNRSVSSAATSFLHLPRRQRNGRGELCPGHPGGLRGPPEDMRGGRSQTDSPIRPAGLRAPLPPSLSSLSSRGRGSRRGRRPHRTRDNLASRMQKTRLRCIR